MNVRVTVTVRVPEDADGDFDEGDIEDAFSDALTWLVETWPPMSVVGVECEDLP